MGENVRVKDNGIDFGEGYSLVRVGESLRFERDGTVILEINNTGLGLLGATPAAQGAAYTQTYATADKTHANLTSATLTDNTAGTATTTLEAIPNPTDAPATADALRDDLVAVHWPALRNNFADLAASNNAIIVDLTDLKQLVNSVIDDLQAAGLAG